MSVIEGPIDALHQHTLQAQGECRYVRHNGPEHLICFAPTRSGKGVGLVIPTLITWPASCIVHDIKGENWNLTSGYRSQFGKVLMFDPTNPLSSASNPLLEVRRGVNEVRDAQNIADILIDPEGAVERRDHWEKTAYSLLLGAILHVLYAEADKSLSGVTAFLTNPSHDFDRTLELMKTTRHLGKAGVHPVIASCAQEVLNKSLNERSGVASTAVTALGLYRDPVIATVTGRSDWRITDLVCGSRPASLFLVVPPSDISRTKPLMRLLLNQIGRRLTEELGAMRDAFDWQSPPTEAPNRFVDLSTAPSLRGRWSSRTSGAVTPTCGSAVTITTPLPNVGIPK